MKRFTAYDPNCFGHVHAFELSVSSLGIADFNFYVARLPKSLSTVVQQALKNLVFRSISIHALLPQFETTEAERIQFLWDELLQLNVLFSKLAKDVSPPDINSFEFRTCTGGQKFIDMYHQNNVTPYIHALMNHVPEFMRLHNSILPFTQHVPKWAIINALALLIQY